MEGLGRIPVSINGVTAAGVTDVSFDENQNQNLRVTADQQTVRTEGKGKYKFSLDGVLLKSKQIIMAQIAEAKLQGELNIGYILGGDEFLLVNCGTDSITVSSDSDGKGDFKISGVATDRLQVR
jgi:hypothetical protein